MSPPLHTTCTLTCHPTPSLAPHPVLYTWLPLHTTCTPACHPALSLAPRPVACHCPVMCRPATTPPSTCCHCRTLRAAGCCSHVLPPPPPPHPTCRRPLLSRAATATTVSSHRRPTLGPPPSEVPPFAATCPTPMPQHFGPQHRVPTHPCARTAPHRLLPRTRTPPTARPCPTPTYRDTPQCAPSSPYGRTRGRRCQRCNTGFKRYVTCMTERAVLMVGQTDSMCAKDTGSETQHVLQKTGCSGTHPPSPPPPSHLTLHHSPHHPSRLPFPP